MPAIWPPMPSSPPEIVARGEGQLDADGRLRLAIDTLPAKELFGNQDHEYTLVVEVRDQSRRTITGTGKLIATREPFALSLWTDRGWYNTGDRVGLHIHASIPSGSGVEAKGEAILSRLTYDADGKTHIETIASQPVATEKNGDATVFFTITTAGQYSISVKLRTADSVDVAAETMLTVRGEAKEGQFRYAGLELVPDQREYAPGDTVKLAVNAGQTDGFVILFIRPQQNSEPSIVHVQNGSAVVDIPVGSGDQPNFFCDAITVSNGKFYNQTREIFVPPAPKTLNVDVTADKENYLPGQQANFSVTVTDNTGKPVEGELVVAVYDRSVEYISGGSTVPHIEEFFWNWKRHYYPRSSSTLNRYGYRVWKDGDVNWEPIGIFGQQEADWNEDGVYTNGRMARPRMRAQYSGAMLDQAIPLPAPAAAMEADSYAVEAEPAAPAMSALAGGGAPAQQLAEPQVRSEFADTALWLASVKTDGTGRATFSVSMPENLTAWKARVWSKASGTRVGEGEQIIETKKNIIIRPQAPRFLTQKDQVVLSANLHNYLSRSKKARAEIVLEGGIVQLAEGEQATREIELSAHGEARVDWLADAVRPGEATIIMKLLTDEESDAAEIRLPVTIHGARRVEQLGGSLRRSENETTIQLTVPAERLADQSRLEFSFSGSLAVQLLDALPYVIEYPYGCTEQTLNRFLPVVMTRSYLDGLGLTLENAQTKGGSVTSDAQSDAWRQHYGDPREKYKNNPVFDQKELEAMTKQGVEQLAAMQVSDGGWGWFSGYGERSYTHTTAVVVHGLLAAKKNNIALPSGMLERGLDWLRAYRQGEVDKLKLYAQNTDKAKQDGKKKAGNLDAFVHMVLVNAGFTSPDMRDFLHRDRTSLSLTGLAMLGIALHEEGMTNALDIVLQNLAQYVERDTNGTAWLRSNSSGWWFWYNDAVEMQAWYLMLLARTDPQGDTASGLAKYLLANRKNGSYWRSTRDTAYAIEALTSYAIASGESKPDMTVALYYDDRKVLERKITSESLLSSNTFVLEGIAVEQGEHTLRLVRSGDGPVYYNGSLSLFSLEDPIRAAGGDLAVKRSFYKLHQEDAATATPDQSGTATAVTREKYRREAMADPVAGGELVPLQPGDLVEVELTITAKNDYEYLVFEDMKAAGLEAVELRSGYSGNRLGAYIEYRDEKVALFIRALPRGTYSLSYRFRAETPGYFSALPVFGGGMYAPELFTNSDEMKIRIEE